MVRQRRAEDGAPHGDHGCLFVLDDPSGANARAAFCDAPRRPGSAYCARHHAVCYLDSDSAAGHRRLLEIEALASAVGGKTGRIAREPPQRLLRRLDRIARAFSRPGRSCFVQTGDADATHPPA